MAVVRVHRKGIIVLPKSVREEAGIEEGMLLEVSVEDGKIVLKPLDLWDRVWGCAKGRAQQRRPILNLTVRRNFFGGGEA